MRTWRVFVILAFAMAFGGHANAQTKLADDTVLASGEGFQITVKDFREYLERFEPLARHRTLSEETIRMIVGNLTNTAVFSAHAAQTKLEGLPHVERETRELAVRQLLIDHKAKADAIGDDEVKKYFEAHPERFLQGELRRASVILLKDKADAEKVLTAAKKADTKAFAELARSKSINLQTRMRGGDLRYFNRDGIPLPLLNMYAGAPEQAPKGSNIDPALVEAAFSLDTIGQTSALTTVGENFAIVRLTGKRDPQYKTWQDAAEHIRVQLRQEKARAGSEELVAKLRKEQQVRVTPKPLENYTFKETAKTSKPAAP